LVPPKEDFVPYKGREQITDDRSIYAFAFRSYASLATKPNWPSVKLSKIPPTYDGQLPFNAKPKPTVSDLNRCTLLMVSGYGTSVGISGGVLVDSSGIALVNYHFAKLFNEKLVAITSDGKAHRVINVLAADKVNDVALLRLEGKAFPSVSIAAKQAVQGDDIVMIHHSEQRFFTYDRGYVKRNSKVEEATRIEVSCPYAPGGSGCGIFNANHE